MLVHWFNPENDLALAADIPHYTPPQRVLKLHDAGAVLPLWYGGAGDAALCYGVNARWYERMVREFDLQTHIFDHNPAGAEPRPWGWSEYARRFFLGEGFPADVLPATADLAAIRALSHRRTAAAICRLLRERLPGITLAEPAVEVTSIDEAERMLAADSCLILKEPWSSSGRGIVDARRLPSAKVLRQAGEFIRSQGSVMVERAYDKVIDFARLYECRDGECHDLGTSVFTTDLRGSYTGNILAPEADRAAMVASHIPADVLALVAATLREILEQTVAPVYSGILGMDMLVDSSGLLDATVELNLRCTMGYVANRFADMHMHPEARGVFTVATGASDDTEYTVDDHRLRAGSLLLTPPNANFSFVAHIDGR